MSEIHPIIQNSYSTSNPLSNPPQISNRLMGKARGAAEIAQCLMLLAALAMVVVFALAGTVGAFSSIFYKGTQCDFNAILICTAIGCTLLFGLVFACVLIAAPKLRTVAYVNVIASVPGLMLLIFAIYGTVLMSSSKTCQATSKKGATTLIGDLYTTTCDLVGSAYVIVCFPLILACAEQLGMKIGTSMSSGAGYGSGSAV